LKQLPSNGAAVPISACFCFIMKRNTVIDERYQQSAAGKGAPRIVKKAGREK
jgi:hypothetical protein